MKPTVEKIVRALPPEDRMRLRKMATLQKKSVEELVIFLLSKGASTYTGLLSGFATASTFVLS